MTLTSILLRAAETSGSSSQISPYWVGGSILLVLAALMGVLLVFGAGREHS